MKKALFVLGLCVLSINISAQINMAVVDTTKIWSTVYTYEPYIVRTYKYKISGDSLINGLKYYKVLQTSLHVNDENNYSFNGMYLREDSNIVYCFENGIESILYNFNLNKGDSIYLLSRRFGEVVGTHLSVVDSVDTITIHNTELKRIYITAHSTGNGLVKSQEVFVQGIGSLGGLFESGKYYELNSDLSCVEQGGEHIYINDSYNSCYNFVGLEYNIERSKSVKLYPTITKNAINISSANYPIQIKIYDLNGNKIMSKIIYNKEEISLLKFKCGVYIINILEEGTIIESSKIIKMQKT